MPNWAKGSLKLRGKKENIAQALKYMFCTVNNVEIEEDLESGWFELTTTAPYFYINGTRRAFIDRKRKKLKFQKAKLSKMFVMNMMIIDGKLHLVI